MRFDRREKILRLLREQNTVMLKDLERMFPEVSSMTLRRDLEFFENIGEAIRIRGGARYTKSLGTDEEIYALRAVKNPAAKDKIAKLAAGFVETGRSIFIDSGSTGMSLARALPDLNFTILAGAPNVAMEVSKRFKPGVTLIGGLINRNTLSVSGSQSLRFIESVNIDMAFLVPSAFSLEYGFTCGNAAECELKKAIIAKAACTVMLVDSSKFGKSMPYTFASMPDIRYLITEQRPGDEVMKQAEEHGITVLYDKA